MKFANISFSWFNSLMKNYGFNVKEKLIEKYLVKDNIKNQTKSFVHRNHKNTIIFYVLGFFLFFCAENTQKKKQNIKKYGIFV